MGEETNRNFPKLLEAERPSDSLISCAIESLELLSDCGSFILCPEPWGQMPPFIFMINSSPQVTKGWLSTWISVIHLTDCIILSHFSFIQFETLVLQSTLWDYFPSLKACAAAIPFQLAVIYQDDIFEGSSHMITGVSWKRSFEDRWESHRRLNYQFACAQSWQKCIIPGISNATLSHDRNGPAAPYDLLGPLTVRSYV